MKLKSMDKEITVGSANVNLGDRLPKYAREGIRKVASKFFGRLNTASVHFTREGIIYRCSVSMQMGALPTKNAEARDKDIYVAFGLALNKVAKQLRRTKRELRDDKPERTDKDAVLRNGLVGGADQS
jgi:ribosomal subunit interface protein